MTSTTIAACLLVALASAPDAPASAQERPGTSPEKRARDAAPKPASDPAFETVDAAYQTALQAYDQARVEAARGRAPAPTTHPATTYWPRMESVAAGGSARARQWLCEHVAEGVSDPKQRLGYLTTQIDALLACCAADPALFGPITGLKTQAPLVGREPAIAQLDRIATAATNAEVQARAILEQATIRSDRGRATDAESVAAAAELQRSVVLAFPTTRAGREAAEILLVAEQRALVAAMNAWLDASLALQKEGRPATEWPLHPVPAFRTRFEPLANAGAAAAKTWVEGLAPSFAHAEKLGPALAQSSLARDLARQYPLRDAQWARIRMRLLALAVREGPDEPWVRSAAATTADEVLDLAPLSPLPFTTALLERSKVPEARAQALWIEAQTRVAEGSEAEFERAIAALDALAADPSMPGLQEKAASQARALRAVMPGAPLPDARTAETPLSDSEGLEVVFSGYRGRVLMIDVFDAFDPEYAPLVAERAELARALAGQPFEIVGVCTSRLAKNVVAPTLSKAGVTWRCGLAQGTAHPVLGALHARKRPATTILVDAQGVIRARNRPFEELARMARELTAAAAGK